MNYHHSRTSPSIWSLSKAKAIIGSVRAPQPARVRVVANSIVGSATPARKSSRHLGRRRTAALRLYGPRARHDCIHAMGGAPS